jgi:predicted nucleic acid-binding protein
MKIYWDSSAIVEAWVDRNLRVRLHHERGFTRTHSLAEVFASFTGGNLEIRLSADHAAQTVEQLAEDLDFIDLSAREVLAALAHARAKGVRGGRVHDFLHAVAAEKSGADKIITLDENDFNDLTKLKIELV